MTKATPLALTAALVGMVAFALAGLLLIQGNDAMQRVGLFFALIGTIVPALIALLRADQAKTQSDGTLSAVARVAEGYRQELPAATQKAVLDKVAVETAVGTAPPPPADPASTDRPSGSIPPAVRP